MAWTASSFQTAYPEFADTDTALVDAALADAVRENDARVFGTSTDRAVALYAADILSTSPMGQQARLDAKDDGQTTYRVQWERLARAKGGGPLTIGQRL